MVESLHMRWGVRVLRSLTHQDALRLREKGFAWVQTSLPWGWVEKTPGAREWQAVERWLAPMEEAGLSVVGMVGQGFHHLLPTWAVTPGGVLHPEYLLRLGAYVEEVVARHPSISHWMVEDCLNAWAWDHFRTRRRKASSFRDSGFRQELLTTLTRAVRSGSKEARIHLTLATAVPRWRRVLAEWQADGIPFDVVGLSTFPCQWIPEPHLAERVGEVVAEVRSLLPRHEVEVAATGFPTHSTLFTHAAQRHYLTLAATSARREGASGFFVSTLKDQAHDDPDFDYWMPSPERHLGLWRYDGTPKAAFDEMRVVIREDRYG